MLYISKKSGYRVTLKLFCQINFSEANNVKLWRNKKNWTLTFDVLYALFYITLKQINNRKNKMHLP